MAQEAASWVTVREAADEVGTTEARVRAAYRTGKLTAYDVRIAGRVRKMVSLEDVRTWRGGAEEVPTASVTPLRVVPAPAAVAAPADALRYDELVELAEQAIARSARAENQVAFLRNELAQLRESHLRIQADVDRRNAEQFRNTARLACADALGGSRRSGIRRILRRASA